MSKRNNFVFIIGILVYTIIFAFMLYIGDANASSGINEFGLRIAT